MNSLYLLLGSEGALADRAMAKLSAQLQDEKAEITTLLALNFLGRREIAGLEVGMAIRAEGMVGEEEGTLVILNPSYELLVD